MPVFTIETPGGKKVRIEAADQATAVRGAREWHESQAKVGPVFDPLGDAARAVRPALERAGDDIKRLQQGKPASMANPFATIPLAAIQAVTNQVSGPVSRVVAKLPTAAYGRPAAPWDERFGQPARKLEGRAKSEAIEGDINTALMGLGAKPAMVKPLPPVVARQSAARVRAAQALKAAQERDAVMGQVPAPVAGVMPIHQGGENLAAVADVIANSPGPGRPLIRQSIRDYEADAVGRTKADIANDLGGRGDYFETLDNLVATRKTEADAGMRDLEMQPVSLDENSIGALRSDLAKSAIRDRAQDALASPDPVVRESGASLNRLADEVLDNPAGVQLTLRDAQDISRTLQQQASAAYRAGNGGRGEALAGLGKAIRSNAADPERGGVAGYGDWLKKYGDDLSNEEALQMGRDAFKPSSNAEQLRKQVGEMSEAERTLFQKGVGEAMLDRVRGSRGDVGALRDLMKSEENADRLALAFPDDKAFANFMDSAARRVAERDVNSRIMGGSPTDPRMAARADLEDEGVDTFGIVGDALTGNWRGLTGRGAKAAGKAIPRKARSVVKDPDANLAIAKALTDPDEMTALLNTLNAARARRARWNAIARRAAPPLLAGDAAGKEATRAAAKR
ncbi:MAG: hypothetical protein V4820_11595 [Pseudomonadota bacterium]